MIHPHPSVRALLDADGGTDPVAAIRRRARALVAKALAMGWEGPPFDMTELASLQGLKVKTSTAFADDQDACVIPGQVLLNARKHPVRRRYSIAHEIGHTLFPDYEDEVRRAGRLWRRDGDDSEFERLCQVAGAELLLPLDAFLDAVVRHGISLLGALSLAKLFDASIEATLRRLVETAEAPLVALLLRPVDPETGAWLDVRGAEGHSPYIPLGVSLFSTSGVCGPLRIVTGTRPPKGSAADRAWKRAALARGTVVTEYTSGERWTHAGVSGAWYGEAMTLPKGAAVPHEVMCLLRRIDS